MSDYNFPKAMKHLRRLGSALAMWFALGLAMGGTAAAASRWDEPAAELARKIAAASGPGTATLEMRNASTLAAEQVAVIRRALEARLRAEGIQLRGEHEASVGLRVTLSENRRGWLWIAEVQLGTETKVAMLELPAERKATAAPNELPMTLQSTRLISSDEPLLDMQPLHGSQELLVALTPHALRLYSAARWQVVSELPIPLASTMPLDPRGRLVVEAGHIRAYLPGGNCAAESDKDGVFTLHCLASDDAWPLGGQSGFYNPARNYFAGTLVPGVGKTVAPFYTAAALPRAKYVQWIFAGIDGRVSSFDGTNELRLSGAANGWGSDLAALHSECGSGAQLLATAAGDDGATDSVQAFEIAGREPTAVSAPLKFEGTITALWSAEAGRSSATQATAIVHNARGGYDAHIITPACNR